MSKKRTQDAAASEAVEQTAEAAVEQTVEAVAEAVATEATPVVETATETAAEAAPVETAPVADSVPEAVEADKTAENTPAPEAAKDPEPEAAPVAPAPKAVAAPVDAGATGSDLVKAVAGMLKQKGYLAEDANPESWDAALTAAYKGAYFSCGGKVFAGNPAYVPEPTSMDDVPEGLKA